MSKRSNQKRKERMKRSRPSSRSSTKASGDVVQAAMGVDSPPQEDGKDHLPIGDEFIKAPREQSKLQFAMMIALIIFLLLIFAIPGALLGGASGGGGGPLELSWNGPSGQVEINAQKFEGELRAFSEAMRADPLAFIPLLGGQEMDQVAVARILVLEDLAMSAGVRVTDQDLQEHLQTFLSFGQGTPDDWLRIPNHTRIEGTLRRALTAGRYLQLVGFAGALPSPDKIEELFHDQHEEVSFDYIALKPEDMHDEARLSLPGDTELAAWLDEQDDATKEELKTPEKRSGEILYFKDAETTPAQGLVEAFPEEVAEGEEPTTPEALQENYYNEVYFFRFKKPADDPEALTQTQAFFTKEEVQDRLVVEAPIFFALRRYLTDLQERQRQEETIDLAAEAEQYGLGYARIEEPLDREELRAHPFFEGEDDNNNLLTSFDLTPEGSFTYSVSALKNALAVGRVQTVVERVMPPFEEIREQVAQKWIEPRAEELVEERMKAMWESLETFEPEEDEDRPTRGPKPILRRADADRFASLATENGLTVAHRALLDKGAPITDDPDWQEAPNKFISTNKDFHEMEVGQVAEPRFARDGTACYLVRVAEKQPVSIDTMTPAEYENLKSRARSYALGEPGEALDFESLRTRYNVRLQSEIDREKREAEEAAAGS